MPETIYTADNDGSVGLLHFSKGDVIDDPSALAILLAQANPCVTASDPAPAPVAEPKRGRKILTDPEDPTTENEGA
jgi:hypothetical protein